ncbi:MAG: rod shape-determining protein RodA [Actinobacteria bacterium BACL4 MAG-120820-bin23]|jgi:rod shape determining protein RodA|uniref:rod shape-determining protein RodA n=1 Tax=Candidatus Nanopelagicus sp. TaxID=2518620 RepID=UPI0007153324|nr:MAG: rod shape-determining protein RodA [Actinobacteria bacterium BACL4 MAG-121022-bin9]KRO49691.1 MAG: rod shape-determining protein RodA [Actinobacteria bacterium BACL4 MAG-120820-bin23]KRO51356.1 MAG: rod shape-determining protein RodA [Actinobacteria bacterium BACL4 MAG-121001-bin59]KRO77307.1 MAG: rod shape-determining protein RodA [Actinobacteria bacterium BACL4 MAG-120920-bin74]KRO92455.1 MAG: rod shape-determining protein RodA [Actinobacteria bacterium BACL4 MAG-120507-bin0]
MSQSVKYRADRRLNLGKFDNILNFAVIGLLAIGTLLVYAGTREWFRSYGLDPEYYLKRHSINIVIGVLLAYGTTLIDYRLLRAYTPIIWLAAVVGLVLVLIPGIGSEINGARAWIALPGGFQIQPAELAKIAIIVGIAMILADRDQVDQDPSDLDVLKALAISAVPILLIVAQPDLGTVLIISAAVVAMIGASGARAIWVVGLLLLGVVGVFTAVQTGAVNEYQVARLQSFVDPNADPQATGYQLRQSRITIGSGGLFGKGLFEGPQTNGRFVPEQQTDFIFTVAGEELGFVGGSLILFLYFLIFLRAFAICKRSSDLFGRLVCIGVIAWFGFQTFENIGMAMGLMPMTGVPLPFLSYGGSSMFANLIGIGLLQNVYARSR